MSGNMRRAFDRSVTAGAKEGDEAWRLDRGRDAALVEVGRSIADHLDGVTEDVAARLSEVMLQLEGEMDAEQAKALANSIDRLVQRFDKSAYLSPHLVAVCKELYLSPKSRNEGAAIRPATVPKAAGALAALKAVPGGRGA